MQKVLVDTDVILDLILDCHPFVLEATALWDANIQGRFKAYISAITPINVFYIGRKIKGAPAARLAVAKLLAMLPVCAVDLAVLQAAQHIPFADYEDAVQHTSAVATQLDAIVTRNLTDYANATLPVFSPADFLKQLP